MGPVSSNQMLLRFARQVVSSVLIGVTQQINMLEQQVNQPIQAMTQQVTGGVWTGQGADAFVNELKTMATPNVQQISTILARFTQDLTRAEDVIDQADTQISQLIGDLTRDFTF